ncbi:hypothetical protein V6N13_065249 [Hibiscus sabdariffa]
MEGLTYIEEFDDNLQKLENLGPTSIEDLLQNPVQHWTKAYFSATSTCDVVDNNMAETFNAWILDARCKPIISLLEDIRVMGTTQNVALSTTGPPGMVHGSTQNVASATTGPPGMVHGTTHNIASATT